MTPALLASFGLAFAPATPVPDLVPSPTRPRTVALNPSRILEGPMPPGGMRGYFFLDSATDVPYRKIKMRVGVDDPDGTMAALEVRVDGGAPLLVDQAGPIRGRRAVGFAEEGHTPYFEVEVPPRGGPHRLSLRGRPFTAGGRADRWVTQARVLSARFFDPVATFEGMRDLADLMSRRYRILRDLDLRVRRGDPTTPPLDPAFVGKWHAKDTFEAHLGPAVRRHVAALNRMTFASHGQKADPVMYLWEALGAFQHLYYLWQGAPPGGRTSWLYQGGPVLYEYLDEVSQAFGRTRESYYAIAGVRCCGADDPAVPAVRRLADLRRALEALLDVSVRVHGALEARAERVAGGNGEGGLPRAGEFSKVKAFCRDWANGEAPRVVEPGSYRLGDSRGGNGRGAGGWLVDKGARRRDRRGGGAWLRGVGRAAGPAHQPLDPGPRLERDTAIDRYGPERDLLTRYLNDVRELAQHDLRLVLLWQALLAGRQRPAAAPRAPGWRPPEIARLKSRARRR